MDGNSILAQWTALTVQGQTLFELLSPINRIRVITGLFVVLVLGVVLFLVIKAGAHMVQGFGAAAKRLPPTSVPDEDDWANRPLNPSVDPKDE